MFRKIQSFDQDHHHSIVALNEVDMDATPSQIICAELPSSKCQVLMQPVLGNSNSELELTPELTVFFIRVGVELERNFAIDV